MPAEDRKSDCSSLNWEEFFVSSNTEDLLPCLLGMYDSIAAARKLNENDDNDDDEFANNDKENAISTPSNHVIDNETDKNAKMAYIVDNDWNGCQSTSECSASANTTSELPWCHFRDISAGTCSKSANGFSRIRPASPASITSTSSRCSVCSHASSSDGSADADNESERRCIDDSVNLADESADSLVLDDSNRAKNAKASTTQPRTSYTTASQYSEDSGIYSNLIRSESLHDRSWYCSDGEDFTYTNRVVLEILETELVYVNDLHQIITGYLDEWKNDRDCALSREQIHDLFNNIEEIYNFNRCFLWELEQCGLDPVKIARCFVDNNANFSIYAAYCTNYPRSISILTELMRQEKTAHLFRERQIRLHHTLPLGSYLLKPVQRILKYHLLLQNMVKHTPPDATGYNDITIALSTMTGIAHHINTMKRRHEHAVRVQEVQSLLTGWQGPDLTTFGELYAEGSFRISGAKAFRHIFLFEHMLLVTKKKEAGILNYKTHILCSNLMLVECIPKEPLSFQIIPFDNPRLQFSIHARSLEEKRHWTLELKRVILENYNVNIPSHARQLVMELGQVQHSDNATVEKMSFSKRQLSTPEYLERRKVDREKKVSMKSRLLPLFRKLDSLQNHKMRSKLKKNQFLSEGSIFSDTSANSDESYSNDNDLQNLSKTTEDLSQTCDEMTRTLTDLSKSSVCSSFHSSASQTSISDANAERIIDLCADADDEQRNSYQQKEKLIEEIIGQLLIASQKFQKAIKDHEMSVRSKQQQQQNGQQQKCSKGDCRLLDECVNDDEDDDDDDIDDELSSSCDLDVNLFKYAKEAPYSTNGTVHSVAEDFAAINTSSESLSASLHVLTPTPPNVWLKQQARHLATPPHKKADSLPRTFQVSVEDEWRANRPKTIASDKPTQMSGTKRYEQNECEIRAANGFMALRNKQRAAAVSVASLNATMVHPECKFYRTSVARMTLKRMMRTLSSKLLSRRGKSERFYRVEHDFGDVDVSAGRTPGKYVLKRETPVEDSTAVVVKDVVYRLGSSDLGARIANGKELSDYADPKVLFPTITPSKKAASLLGIRSYSHTRSSRVDLNEIAAANSAETSVKTAVTVENGKRIFEKGTESDCSADSFYERQFEEVECEFENAIRETSILNDTDDLANVNKIYDIGESFRRYSRINVNISVHKLIKIPPPVPAKVFTSATIVKSQTCAANSAIKARKNFTSSVGESCIPTRGWVKQVVEKFQSTNDLDFV